MTIPTPRALARDDDRLVEEVAEAIDAATEQNYNIQSFDYSRHGANEPFVIRDLSLPSGSQTLWQGKDRDDCVDRYNEIKRTRLATAALTVARAHFAALSRQHGAAIRGRGHIMDSEETTRLFELRERDFVDFAKLIEGKST